MIAVVSKTGAHLGANLGVVELTVALHTVFDTPKDKLIWDTGHQAYPHKMLTGRRHLMSTLRQGGGLSGFTMRSESEYDPFGAAHSGTAVSAGLGMAVARDCEEKKHNIICVVGDGAMSSGMAFEALNNAGAEQKRLIVILNDNDMSIDPPTGALSKYLRQVNTSFDLKASPTNNNSLFETLGIQYIGPVDGHDLENLMDTLNRVKSDPIDGPVLIHVRTEKGKGYLHAEAAKDKMHGVKAFDVISGQPDKIVVRAPAYTDVFADHLIKAASKDKKIMAITAAMPTGTGIGKFAQIYPGRAFDVGIAEQHAVTFAAGLAAEGYKPFVAIYSTFLQRAYDQIIHDVAIQNLPVRFAIDRAGLVGADGQTHAGAFDIAYLGSLPNMVLMAAANEAELASMVYTAASHNDGPIAFRYPRGNGIGEEIADLPPILEIGKGRIILQGKKLAILSYGARLEEALEAARILYERSGQIITVADARFAKPLDTQLIQDLQKSHDSIITIEEGSACGFGALVLQYMADAGLLDDTFKIRTMHLPDIFQDHDTPDNQYKKAKLNSEHIVKIAQKLLQD